MDKASMGIIIYLAVIIGAIIFVPFGVYYSSCRKAEVYNKIEETDFTCSDFFWAESQIRSNSQLIELKQ